MVPSEHLPVGADPTGFHLPLHPLVWIGRDIAECHGESSAPTARSGPHAAQRVDVTGRRAPWPRLPAGTPSTEVSMATATGGSPGSSRATTWTRSLFGGRHRFRKTGRLYQYRRTTTENLPPPLPPGHCGPLPWLTLSRRG